MPAYDDIHPELVSRWIIQAVTANASLVTIHGPRLYQDVNIPDNPTFPYLYWSGSEEKVAQWLLGKEYIGKIRSTYNVRSVRKYVGTGASLADFAASYKALRDALTGVYCTEVLVGAAVIGHIFQSRYLDKYAVSYRDGDIRIIEHGIRIDVIHK